MELLKVDSLYETIKKLHNAYVDSGENIEIEEVRVSESFDRVLACDITSSIDVPSFNRSTVDGYAVISKDTAAASDTIPTILNIVGESKMGEDCKISLKPGECVYVPTGGMIPKGSDAVVMVENTENISDAKIAINESVSYGKSIVRIADDIKKDEKIFDKGRIIRAADLGLLSAIGIKKVKVYKKWKISIISTGDELVDVENVDINNIDSKVIDINTNLLVGLSKEFGFEVIRKKLVKDDEKLLENCVKEAMKDCDVVVISGGSSKGKKDATANVIDKLTSTGVITHGISIKPGKPTITGYDKDTNCIVIGLPGHPVACAILFRLIVKSLYEKLTNQLIKQKICKGKMSENIPTSPGRMTFQLVNIDDDFNVKPVFGRSGLIHTLSYADGYIVIDRDNEGIKKGEEVIVHYL